MKRGIEERLRGWKTAARRKPLIVRGARQVGKTWSIEQFGRTEFRNVVTIDFEKRPILKPLFASELSPAVLVEQLELATGQAIRLGETLLFLDEIRVRPPQPVLTGRIASRVDVVHPVSKEAGDGSARRSAEAGGMAAAAAAV